MRRKTVRVLLAPLGFGILLGVAGRGAPAPHAAAAALARATATDRGAVVADEDGGSDDSGDDQGDDSD